MEKSTERQSDVVSEILKDTDLLDAFTETLTLTTEPVESFLEKQSTKAVGRLFRIKVYFLRNLKNVLSALSNKIQVMALLAEYHVKNELRHIKNTTKK